MTGFIYPFYFVCTYHYRIASNKHIFSESTTAVVVSSVIVMVYGNLPIERPYFNARVAFDSAKWLSSITVFALQTRILESYINCFRVPVGSHNRCV